MRLFTNLTALTLSTSCLATPLSTSNPPLLSHVYTFKELQSKHSKHSSHQPYFRFNIFLRKNPHITEAAFHQHWKSVHADLTISQPDAGLRLLRYTQFHAPSSYREKIQPLVNATGGLLEIAPYDGVAEFLTRDCAAFEQFIMQIFRDPVLVADQQSFVDARAAMQVMAGYDELVFGDAIDAAKGRDGILPGDKRLVYSRPQ